MIEQFQLLGGRVHPLAVYQQLIGVQIDDQLVKGQLFLRLLLLTAGTAEDGVWEGSFYGTHLIGPLLMKNPHVNAYFTELLCRRAGLPYQPQDCPHEQRAYEVTLRALQERFQQQ